MHDVMVGKKLPDLNLACSGGTGKLAIPNDLQGKWTLLYFYPKDDTPGCTAQACSYRDHLDSFATSGIDVYGVSADDIPSHEGFREKYQLNFPLLADTSNALSGFLGVYGDQEWNGRVFKGLSRDSFLIDPQGVVRKAWRKVSPATTVNETLEAARALINA